VSSAASASSSGAPSPPAPARGWRAAVFSFFFLNGLALAVWMARLPSVRDDLSIGVDSVGMLGLGLAGGSIAGLLLAGPLLARLGARRSLVIGMIGLAVGVTAVGASSSLLHSGPLVFAGLALTGVSNAFADVVMNVEGADAERAYGRTLMPRLHAGFSLGGVFGAVVGAATAGAGLPVVAFFAPMGLVILLGGLIAVRWIPRRPELGDDTATAPPFRDRLRASLSVWRDPRLLLIGFTLLAFAFAEGSANDWIAIATVDGRHLDNTAGAAGYGLFVGVMTVLRFFGGPLLDRFGRVPVLRASILVAVAGIILFVFVPGPLAAAAGILLWACGASFGFPVAITAASEGPQGPQRVAAAALMGYAAFLVGPPVLGFIGEHAGILLAFLPPAGLLVLALLTVQSLREQRAGRGPAGRAAAG